MKITASPEDEDFYGKYEKSGRIGQCLLKNYFKIVQELTDEALNKGQINKALEIGCGPGYSTQKISKILPDSVQFEASEYVEALTKAAKKNNPGVKIWQEDIYKLKSKDNSYDLIYLLEVLEHLDYPDAALAEIKRVLKPGGWLILGVPREPLWRFLNMARGSYWNSLGNTPGHLNHWSANSIQKFIKEKFGEVIETETPLPWSLTLSKVKKR